MNQRTGVDFFQARLQSGDVPQKVISTVTFTSRECPCCKRYARTLIRPPQNEMQSEVCDFCEPGWRQKYPSAVVSFRGSWLRDGFSVIEALKGEPGPPGRDGKDAPTREEIIQGLFERTKGLRKLLLRIFFGRIK